jgi:erythritol transport system permease protein
MSTQVASSSLPTASGANFGVLVFKFRAFIALFILLIIFSFLTPSFLTRDNLIILVGQAAINAIMAIGMTFVIITGGIDLSVGSIAGLSAMASGLLLNRGVELTLFDIAIYFNVPMILLLVMCLGMLVGAFNGLLVTRLNVAPFIATLGTLYVARGLAQLSNNGATFPNLVGKAELQNTGFPILGSGVVLGIPLVNTLHSTSKNNHRFRAR